MFDFVSYRHCKVSNFWRDNSDFSPLFFALTFADFWMPVLTFQREVCAEVVYSLEAWVQPAVLTVATCLGVSASLSLTSLDFCGLALLAFILHALILRALTQMLRKRAAIML